MFVPRMGLDADGLPFATADRSTRASTPSTGRRRRPVGKVHADRVGIAYNECMQYTIRGITPQVDTAARERAEAEGKSLNDVVLEALVNGLGLSEDIVRRDLSDIVGTWKKDGALEAALAARDRVEGGLWK
jgi:hypothetical protein